MMENEVVILGKLLIIIFGVLGFCKDPSFATGCSSLVISKDSILISLETDTVVDKGILPMMIPHPIKMSSGITAVWRTRNPKYEVAAYELSKVLQLNLVPPTVFRKLDGESGALQLFIDGNLGGEFSSEALFFDFITQEGDRHSGNFLYSKNNKVILFDHEKSFQSTDTSKRTLSLQLIDARNSYLEYLEGGFHVQRMSVSTLKKLNKISDSLIRLALKKWLSRPEIEAIIIRKRYYLDHLKEIYKSPE